MKSEWLDRRLRLNLAAFYNDYKDLQITVVTPGTVNALVENAGTATIKGVEAELVALPVSGLRLTGSAGYQYSEYTSLQRRATVTLSSRLPYAPRWTTSFMAEYTLPVSTLDDLTLRGDVS